MKRLLAILIAIIMVIGLVACGDKKEDAAKDTEDAGDGGDAEDVENGEADDAGESSGEGKTYKIGVTIYQYSDNFMTLYRNELEKYFGELGAADGNTYEVEFQDGKNDQNTQNDQLNNFIAQKKDLIIANLVETTGADQFLKDAQAADIPVVLINREPKELSTMEIWPGKTTYVGVDARQSGIYQGEIIAETPNKGDFNGDGVVNYIMIMGDAGNVDAEQRTEFSVKTLEKTIKTEILGEAQRGNWDQTKGQEITANALTQYGDKLEVVFSNNDGMALGAMQAIEGAGRIVGEDIYLVGVDALPEVVEAIGNGKFTGTVLNDHFNQAHTAAEIAVKLLNGEDVEPFYWHDYVKVTKVEDSELERKEWRAESIADYEARLAEYEE
ncbi:MAG: galactose ABC transporter substrate-binding protein [Saccharofermentanales bacterium]